MMKKILYLILIFTLILVACKQPKPNPKPIAYFRINLPQHSYKTFAPDSCPFAFKIPTYAKITPDPENPDKKCWMNIVFPSMKATISITYYKIDQNLSQLIDDSYTLAYKHSIKADDIEEITVVNDKQKVYGTIFNITGNAASPLQFHLTDSAKHFFRASLYFNARPNRDSLSPVINFLKVDIDTLINSFRWQQ